MLYSYLRPISTQIIDTSAAHFLNPRKWLALEVSEFWWFCSSCAIYVELDFSLRSFGCWVYCQDKQIELTLENRSELTLQPCHFCLVGVP